MDQDFLMYLIKTKKLDPKIVGNIEAMFGQGADYETENKINDIIELLEECQLNPNVYLIQYPELLELAKIEDREELKRIIEYILEYKKKKEKNPYLLIQLMLAAREIIEKQKQQETEQIIALLKREGLMKIFEPKTNKTNAKVHQILHSEYSIVSRNIRILKKEKKYKELVYATPLILINPNEKEVRKLLEQYQNKNSVEDKKEEDKQKQTENDNDEERESQEDYVEDIVEEKTNNDKKDEDVDNKKQNNTNKINVVEENKKEVTISGQIITLQEKRLLELGDEEKVLPILEAFNKYGITYEVLNNNPDILKRTKIFNIPAILELLYLNNIHFSVIYDCSEILQKGKADEIAEIIDELKTRGISLTILLTCPSILINSTPERIREMFIKLENNNIDKYLVYSTPTILISGDIDKYIQAMRKIDNDITESIEEIVETLPNNYIVFKELTQSKKDREFLDKKDNEFDAKEILIIDDISNAKEVLNTLNHEGIDIEVVTKEPNILSQQSEEILEISQKIKQEKLGLGIITTEPSILFKTNTNNINNILLCLKKYRPETAKKIVKNFPSIMYLANTKDMELIFKQLEKNNIDLSIVEMVPQILLRKDIEEISKVISNLNGRGYTTKQITDVPEILVRGKEQYINRNFMTFERNNINIPLSVVHCISARNNEKNIDTLIENDLDRYIELTPEILELKNSRLMQLLEISKENNIPVFKNIKNKETGEKNVILNMEYFKSTDEQIMKKYDLNIKYIRVVGQEAEREENKLRRIKNTKLYEAVYPILEKQAVTELREYQVDNVAYLNNGKRVSKQKVIREAYLDLEAKTAKEGKSILKEIDTKKMLTKKLKNLSKTNIKRETIERDTAKRERV